jgi:solute:Na+ symporter, SSS family
MQQSICPADTFGNCVLNFLNQVAIFMHELTTGMPLGSIDVVIVVVYLALTMVVGFYAGSKRDKTSKGYFMADRRLPWYVIGTSMVAADLGAQHFIAQVGASYARGIVIAAFGWNAWIVYGLLIWIFLPYYMRSNLYTMPEFLERRFNPACRNLFAVFLTVGYIASLIGGSLYAGALIVQSIFGFSIVTGVLLLGIATGLYTVYGGLNSAAWTDFLQMAILMSCGLVVPILALRKVGGIAHLAAATPAKFYFFQPPTDPLFPVTGIFTAFLTIGIWYNCTSQHMVQRCLAAKDEWNARMGIIFAGFLHIIMPLLFVIPGIIAFNMMPHLVKPDLAYLGLLDQLIPAGLKGLVLAAMAAAMMSTLATVLNSSATVLTLDLYRKLWKPNSTEAEQVRFGRWNGAVTLAAGMLIAIYYSRVQGWFLFVLIQNVFAYIAPPFAVIFTLGILWRRANGKAALATILLGLPFGLFLQQWIFAHVAPLHPYDSYLHRALISWVFCMALMICVSLATAPPPAERTDGIIWRRQYAALPADQRARYSGWLDYRVWYFALIAVVCSFYILLLWFQFARH